jgi:gliding motility-associated-like protein
MKKYLFLLLFLILLFDIFAQIPVANFTQNQTSGCGTLLVNFQNTSTGGTPMTYFWEFGDGTTSTFENPSKHYNAPGTYTVKLTATNAQGNNTRTQTNLIRVHPRPIVNFVASDTIGCQPFSVNYAPQITGGGNIIQYTWDFGDGNSSTQQNPNYVYQNTGTFTVSLTVRDQNQCTGARSKINYVIVNPKPTANFVGQPLISCEAPLTTNFVNMSQGNGLTHSWNFGNGNTSSQPNPSQIYNSSGAYTVSLVVENSFGCKDTMIRNNYVDVGSFDASFTANTTSGCVPLAVSFTGVSSSSANFQWRLGDGTNTVGQQVNHTYTQPGQYTVTVIGTNSIGCVDSTTITNYITVTPGPDIDFTANQTSGCQLPFTVTFNNNTPNTQTCTWNFGDGNTATGNTVTHSYQNYGQYTVTVSIVDNAGCTSQIVETAYIKVVKPVPNVVSDIQRGCAPLTVNFSDTSSTTSPITSWVWNFGDGSPTSNNPTPTHTYSDTGQYTVTLTITNQEGCTETIVMTNYIETGMVPVVNFVGDSLFGCHPLRTNFTDLSSSYANEWQWYFGDSQSQEQNPTHTFRDTGYVDVALVVSHYGCSDSLMMEDYVYVRFPKPQFRAVNPVFCNAPDTVNFADQSQGATHWFWDFGDGNTSTQQNPSNIYLDPGSYTVKLRVYNDTTGCMDSTTRVSYIKISEINAGFTIIPTDVCQYEDVCFQDTTQTVFPVTQWRWFFGDGVTNFTGGPSVCHQYFFPGNYNVRLNITDSLGCTKNIIKNNAVTVRQLPSPRLSANETNGCIPFTVNFTDQSFNTEPSNIVGWLWEFGDGNTSTEQNPSHTYTSVGSYHVSLTVTDHRGCDSTKTYHNLINITKPTANFYSDTLICSHDTLSLFNLSIGSGLTYFWNFGNGDTSTQSNPHAVYISDNNQTFPITLVVTDQIGCKDTIVKNVSISTPIADFSAMSQTSDCPPFNASFVNNSSSDVISWLWNFGDSISGSNNISFFQNPQHVYINSGEYDVRLIVKNVLGCSDTITKENYIFIDGPRGTFDFEPKTGCAPLTVTFTSETENAADFTWVFGDGGIATGSSVTWTYTDGGFYLPVLIITDSLNTAIGDTSVCVATIIATDSVYVIQGNANFTFNDTLYCPGQPIQFTDSSWGIGTIASWHWDFGDGQTSNLQNPSYSFNSPGDQQVTLTILMDSCESSITKTVRIFDFPDITITNSDLEGCYPHEVDFYVDMNSVTYPAVQYVWNFNDGYPPITQQNVDRQFVNSGTYQIELTVTFANGCVYTYTFPTDIVVHPLPDANFSFHEDFAYPGDLVNFNDQSTGNIVNWHWNMGDGNRYDSITNFQHSFVTSGYYDVSLFVVTDAGCTDSIRKKVTIMEGIIIPNVFTPNGDGTNDQFVIVTYGLFTVVDLKIYNRWGNLIWYTNNPDEHWDGKHIDSKEEVPDGTYFYVYIGKTVTEVEFKSSGSVTLLR